MNSFFLFISLLLLHFAFTSGVDVEVREMSIDEYINFVNPPAMRKYQSLKKATKLKPPRINISNSDSDHSNISRAHGVKSECPEDTVATMEIKREDVERAGSVRQFLNRGRSRRKRNHITPNFDEGSFHEHSAVRYDSPDERIFRVSAKLNLWSPEVTPDAEFSNSQLWVTNIVDNGEKEETIEVGWMVNEKYYGTAEPTFFVFWTSDDYLNGCYDQLCPGYVAAEGTRIKPGSTMTPVSEIGGPQYEFALMLDLRLEQRVGLVWALFYKGENIGHWPASLFDSLAQGASELDVGGEVCHNSIPSGPMTTTQMGSGRFAREEVGFAAYTRAIQMFDQRGAEFDPEYRVVVEKPRCYSALYVPRPEPSWGKNIFFGGPGGTDDNPACVA